MSFQENAKNWEPPDGLGYSSLRPVGLTGQGIALAVVGSILLIAAPVLGLVIANQSKNSDERQTLLREQGADATAVITRVWRDGGRDSRRMVSYRFDAGDGKTSVPKGIWAGLKVGATLPIRYLPERPGVNHPTEWEPNRTPLALPYAIGAIMVIPVAAFVFMIRRQMRLLSEGRPAPGVVTSLRRTDKAVTVFYEFTLLDGTKRKGKSNGGRRPPGIGSSCCILYDPDNPKRNAVYPMPLVKLVR